MHLLKRLSQDFCQVRNKFFYPTILDCQKWYQIINREIFKNDLPAYTNFDIRKRRGTWAYFMPSDEIPYRMGMKYPNEWFFVNILAHEMVHHWQEVKEYNVKHNSSFYQWKPIFEEHGLTLKRVMKGTE